MGGWRSWLARFLDMEEVTGSNPVPPTSSLLWDVGFEASERRATEDVMSEEVPRSPQRGRSEEKAVSPEGPAVSERGEPTQGATEDVMSEGVPRSP